MAPAVGLPTAEPEALGVEIQNMYLRDIAVSVHRDFALPGGIHHRDFNIGTHAAAIAFQRALPKKYKFCNFVKVNIVLSSKPERDKTFKNQVDVATYYHEGFPFDAYLSKTRGEQEQILLATIRDAMLAMIEFTGADPEPIMLAYHRVLDQDFPLDNSWVKQMEERIRRRKTQQTVGSAGRPAP